MSKERKPSPDVRVIDPFLDERHSILQDKQSEDPDYVYSWQRGDITARELTRSGQMIVKDGDAPLDHNGDILVKQPKDVYKKNRELQSQRSYKTTERIVQNEPGSFKKFAKAIIPRRKTAEDEE
jgi:hypothetical protein